MMHLKIRPLLFAAVICLIPAVGSSETKEEIRRLIQNLSSRDKEVRITATAALGVRPAVAQRSVPHLLKLLSDPNYEVADRAFNVLKVLVPRTPNALRVILKFIDSGVGYGGVGIGIQKRKERCRVSSVAPGRPAARAKIREGDGILAIDGILTWKLSISEIMYMVRGESNTSVRFEIEHSGASRNRSIRLMREFFKHDHGFELAVQLLEKAGTRAEDLPVIVKLLRRENPRLRFAALRIFERMGFKAKGAVDEVVRVLWEDASANNRGGAARTLEKIGGSSQKVRRALRNALRDKDSYARKSAAIVSLNLGFFQQDAETVIIKSLRAAKSFSKGNELQSWTPLKRLTPRLKLEVRGLLHDENQWTRSAAVQALARFGYRDEALNAP